MSAWELSNDAVFRGKAKQALAKQMLDLATNGSDEEKANARRYLSNIVFVMDQLIPLVCAAGVDSTSNDATIEKAALTVLKAGI
jgi:hypothetical protein